MTPPQTNTARSQTLRRLTLRVVKPIFFATIFIFVFMKTVQYSTVQYSTTRLNLNLICYHWATIELPLSYHWATHFLLICPKKCSVYKRWPKRLFLKMFDFGQKRSACRLFFFTVDFFLHCRLFFCVCSKFSSIACTYM